MTHRTLPGLACVATLLLAALSACGDDESSDVCATLDSLNSAIVDVSDGDISQDTLTKLEDEVGNVQTDLEQIRSEASDDYSTEIEAVSKASESLTTSLDAARATPSRSAAADVVSANQALVAAVKDLGGALDDTC